MANYYTLRLNPGSWPPEGAEIPTGVEAAALELAAVEGCCPRAVWSIRSTRPVVEKGIVAWTYVTECAAECPDHGPCRRRVGTRLDWISPNEYLVDGDGVREGTGPEGTQDRGSLK